MKNCIISFENKKIVDTLTSMGYKCISTIESLKVSAPINTHADVLYLKNTDKSIIISDCQIQNQAALQELGFDVYIFSHLKKDYKTECFLNMVTTENSVIYNPKTCIEDNIDIFKNKEKIQVNQGYTKCSTIVVNNNTFLTDDVGIYKKLLQHKKNCLLVKKGIVELKGYDYGFIGGASAMIKKDTLLFFGDIEDNDEKEKIIEYLKLNSIKPIFIQGQKLVDIGGAIIL